MSATASTPRGDRWSRRLSYLDAFPKIEKNITNASGSGGVVSIIVTIFLAYLILSELITWMTLKQEYEYLVDQTPSSGGAGLLINVDLTVAMPCNALRADVLDVSQSSIHIEEFKLVDTVFSSAGAHQYTNSNPTPPPLNVHELLRNAQRGGHALHFRLPSIGGEGRPKGCRIYGQAPVKKLSGMLHITALGHGYMGQHVDHELMNFTHRIDKLSFGHFYPGLHNPLDLSIEYATGPFDMFQYFISIIPTIYVEPGLLADNAILTNQYAVTDYQRSIDHSKGAHGTPGIFIRYDLEALSVRITETRQTFLHFLTRLCGIVGGVFVTAGMILNFSLWIGSLPQAILNGDLAGDSDQ
ncbi:hypothetical protein SmJEL517_g03468 [Synchytrium microbalum]|uniref:Endoplasmic reticulum vesicle transporter C-terminal domain-containing protein n=1 Tax=Synchytrium microbalum TaxID=1806994 RepID=A0A507C2N6_9FUNG|nr:uncharacterized protein SmJEL517_g03468 [Synchytrium microbalum]TPX33691.1 hypothetical protein SmJEL517_g03468 [Synchytrium microbalum]